MLKNFKLKYNTIFVLIALMLVSACDKVPGMIRSVENKRQIVINEKKAKNYDIEAAYVAGVHQCCGEDTPKNDVASLNNFCKGALQNHKASQLKVAEYFANRTSKPETIIPMDLPLAYAYASIASENGSDEATNLRQSIAKKMNGNQLSEAASLISSFPNVPCEIIR